MHHKITKFKMFKVRSFSSYISLLLLFIIPIILLVSSINVIEKRGKNWYGGGYDPSYAYLYNSLNIARFRLPGHADHPGTTMQITGAIILQAAWMVNPYGGENLTEAVISEPEHYLRILNISSAIIAAACVLFVGWLTLSVTSNIWLALIMQITPFISGLILYQAFLRISQENMLFVSSMVLSAFTLYWYYKHQEKKPGYFATGFGIIAGFGLVSKITFLPLLAIPLLLINTRVHLIKFIKVTVISFVAFTIPIIMLYPHMAWWFLNLFLHSGIYGTGEKTIFDASAYLVSLKGLLTGEPVYFALYLITFISLLALLLLRIIKKTYINKPLTLILLGTFIVQTAGYIITAKHPKLYYLLPYICTSGLVIVLLIDLITKSLKPRLRFVISGTIAIPLVVLAIDYGFTSRDKYYYTHSLNKYDQAWETAITEAKGGAIIALNPGPSPIAASYFANAYSRSRYTALLQETYPDYYIYDTYKGELVDWSGQPFSIDDLMIKYNDNVVLIGHNIDPVIENLTTNNTFEFNKVWTEQAVVAVAGRKE